MTQKKPACLLVVLEECGNDVERERATSLSLFVCSLTFRVLFAPSVSSAALHAVWAAGERTEKTVMI